MLPLLPLPMQYAALFFLTFTISVMQQAVPSNNLDCGLKFTVEAMIKPDENMKQHGREFDYPIISKHGGGAGILLFVAFFFVLLQSNCASN